MSNENEKVSARNVLAILCGFATYGALVAGFAMVSDSIVNEDEFTNGFLGGAIVAPHLLFIALMTWGLVHEKTR